MPIHNLILIFLTEPIYFNFRFGGKQVERISYTNFLITVLVV